jgi:hypothetical protein
MKLYISSHAAAAAGIKSINNYDLEAIFGNFPTPSIASRLSVLLSSRQLPNGIEL